MALHAIFDYRIENSLQWKNQYAVKEVQIINLCTALTNLKSFPLPLSSSISSTSISIPLTKNTIIILENKTIKDERETKIESKEREEDKKEEEEEGECSALEVVHVARAIANEWQVVCDKSFIKSFPQFSSFVGIINVRRDNYEKVKSAVRRIEPTLLAKLANHLKLKKTKIVEPERSNLVTWLNQISETNAKSTTCTQLRYASRLKYIESQRVLLKVWDPTLFISSAPSSSSFSSVSPLHSKIEEMPIAKNFNPSQLSSTSSVSLNSFLAFASQQATRQRMNTSELIDNGPSAVPLNPEMSLLLQDALSSVASNNYHKTLNSNQ